jgi:glycerol kinase
MPSDYVIGVDQGTSSTKALLVDRDGRVAAEAGRPIAVARPRPGWVEQSPEAMVENVAGCLREVLEKAGVAVAAVAGIGLANHTETLVLWDRDSGRSVHPAIVWQCRRSTAEADAVATAANRRLIRERTGLDLDPTFTATKLAWVAVHRPELADGIRRGRILAGTVDSWLIWSLTRGALYATESGNASRTMLFRLDRLAWDPELAALFGLDLPALAEVRPSTGPFGRLHRDWLGAEVPITGVLGDQQASLYGHGCHVEGAFKCTYGTGAFLWMNAGHTYRPAAGAGYLQTVAWHLDRPTYALEGFVMYAGAVLDWLVDNLGLAEDAAAVARLAREAGGSDGVILVPAFQGLGSPWWAPEVRAALLDMSGGTRAGHVCHAALEAVCFQVRRVLDAMAGAAVRPQGPVRADGGLTRSDDFLQLQADILGRPVRRAAIEHITPYGAALLAGVGAGLLRHPPRRGDDGGLEIVPRAASAETWDSGYARWCASIDASLARAAGDRAEKAP